MRNVQDALPHVARVLLGFVFFVFGLNGFLQFLPMPPHPGASGELLGALGATGYMFPLIKGTEVLVGAALLANRFVPLALTVIAPIIVNIAAFHLFLAGDGYPMVAFLLASEIFLAWSYRDAFRAVLGAKASPRVARPHAEVRVATA